MTTPDRYQEIGPDTPIDVGDFMEGLAQMARDHQDQAKPAAAGTFAMYPMEDGGLMLVMSGNEGPMVGVHHMRIRPAMIRAVTALAGGEGKMGALKALTGFGGKRKVGDV